MCLNNILWSKMLSSSISMTELVFTNQLLTVSGEVEHCGISHSSTTSTCCKPYWRIRYSHTQSSWTCNSWGPEGSWTGETETMVATGRLTKGCIKYTSTLPQTTLRKWSSPLNNNTNWDNTHIPDSLGHVLGDVHLLHLPIEVDRLPLCWYW